MTTLTSEEAELYDRQIRAWGFEAQRRMRESKVLLVGLDGAGSETLKNLVLAGLGKITILDNTVADESIVQTHFYVTEDDISTPLVQVACKYFTDMNPNITLEADAADPYHKKDEFYASFDVVILNNQRRSLQIRVNNACRKYGKDKIGFFSSRSFGRMGYIFCDLQTHTFQINCGPTDDRKETEKELRCLEWYPLEDALKVSHDRMKNYYARRVQKFRSYFYVLQVLEQLEDRISTDFKTCTALSEAIRSPTEATNKALEAIKCTVEESGQFESSDCDGDLLEEMRPLWNISVCPANAMLGGYLANFVMFYVQRKEEPLRNVLFLDMWECQAMGALFKTDSAKLVKVKGAVNVQSLDSDSDSDEDIPMRETIDID